MLVPPLQGGPAGSSSALEGLKARASARQEACGLVREALAVVLQQPVEGAAGNGALARRCGDAQGWAPLGAEDAVAAALFASALAEPSAGLWQRWEKDVLGALPSSSGLAVQGGSAPGPTGAAGRWEELESLREARSQAQLQLRVKEERKQKAVEALNRAMISQQQAEEEEEEAHEEEDNVSLSGVRPVTTEKKKKLWLPRKLIPKVRQDKKKRGGSPQGKAGPETAVASLPVLAKSRLDDAVQAANNDLMDAVEDLQVAVEKVDFLSQQCEAVAQELGQGFVAEELAHGRGVREAVCEAALALEKWAVDARVRLRPGGRAAAEEAGSEGEGSFGESPSRTAEDCASSLSTAVSEGEQQEELGLLERRAARARKKNEELLRALPLRRAARAAGAAPLRPPWEQDEGAGGSASSTCDCLAQLAKSNGELESELRLRRPWQAGAELRRSAAALEREVQLLDSIAGACLAVGPWLRAGARAALEGATGGAAVEPPQPWPPGSPQVETDPRRCLKFPAGSASVAASGEPSSGTPSPLASATGPVLPSMALSPLGGTSAACSDTSSMPRSPRLTAPFLPPPIAIDESASERSAATSSAPSAVYPQSPAFGGGERRSRLQEPFVPPMPPVVELRTPGVEEPQDSSDGSSHGGLVSNSCGNPFASQSSSRSSSKAATLVSGQPAQPDGRDLTDSMGSSRAPTQGEQWHPGGKDGNPFASEVQAAPTIDAAEMLTIALNPFARNEGLPEPDGPANPCPTEDESPFIGLSASPCSDEQGTGTAGTYSNGQGSAPPGSHASSASCTLARHQSRPTTPGRSPCTIEADADALSPGGRMQRLTLAPGDRFMLGEGPHVYNIASPTGSQSTLLEPQPESLEALELVQRAFAVERMEVALAQSDTALHSGRLGRDAGYWSWAWREYPAEEQHNQLQECSHSILTNVLSEGDWNLFAYELLLLVLNWMSERDPALEHVRAAVPICRVSLGIPVFLHHRLAELTLPDASQRYVPFDVRFRAALLLRSWTRAEASCFGGEGVTGASPEGTTAWIRRQVAVLRGSILVRALALHRKGREAAGGVCASCLQALRKLDELALQGRWGVAADPGAEEDGRRLLVSLMRDMDSLRPAAGHWRFDTLFAAKVFGQLWKGATDKDSEDRLSMDAPVVAAALLSGLHPHLGAEPLRLETHGILLAQQLWLALSEGRLCGSRPESGLQLPGKALGTAEFVLSDFAQWLKNQELSVNMAALFARRAASAGDACEQEAAELVARRLLTVDLRDGLVHALQDYRRHFSLESFGLALELWRSSHKAMTRSELLVRAALPAAPGPAGDVADARQADAEFARRMGQWFIFKSITATAELALAPYVEPVQVRSGDAEEWSRLACRIKRHVEGLATAVQSLFDELECERSFYGQAWEKQGLGSDHLGVTAAALCAAVRPRVEALVECGTWPTAGAAVIEIPAGGHRLLRALEALDRLASRFPGPRRGGAEPLVDVLLPHVTAALTERFAALDRDITSRTLAGSDQHVFQPLRPPSLLYCDGVVTLWRFIHDALDAQLTLGMPVDIVVPPFLDYLARALRRCQGRLVRPCEQGAAFRLSARVAQVAAELAKNEGDLDSEDDTTAASGNEGEQSRKKRSKPKWPRWKPGKAVTVEEVHRNIILDADLLEVDATVIAPPIPEVLVRLSSLGFCLEELNGVYAKLVSAVNSGDDSDVPTLRHNDARRRICEELPEMQDSLREHCGFALARYLANRLVYHELRQDLFEKLYYEKPAPNAAATPMSASECSGYGADFFPTDVRPSCVTMQDIVAQRQEPFLGLVSKTPPALLVPFIVELGSQLINAWAYVVLDYHRRMKFDGKSRLLDDDVQAMTRLVGALVKEARLRIASTQLASGGGAGGRKSLASVSTQDCDDAQKRLEEMLRVAQMLVLKVDSATAEELARYASRVCGDFGAGAETPAASRGGEVTPLQRTCDRSPFNLRGRSPPTGQRSVSPRTAQPEATRRPVASRGRSASPCGPAAAAQQAPKQVVGTPQESGGTSAGAPGTPTPQAEDPAGHRHNSRPTWRGAFGKISTLRGRSSKKGKAQERQAG